MNPIKAVMDLFGIAPWRGFYKSFADVERVGRGFDDLMPAMLEYTKNLAKQNPPYEWDKPEYMMLPIIAAQYTTPRITDFGGGLGNQYVYLRHHGIPSRYTIVEIAEMCRAGKMLLPTVNFTTCISGTADIVTINGAIQYIEDYARTLRKLAALDANHFIISRVPCGVFPTHAVAQVNHGVMPMWIFNLSELNDIMIDEGYEPRLICPASRKYRSHKSMKYWLPDGKLTNILYVKRP